MLHASRAGLRRACPGIHGAGPVEVLLLPCCSHRCAGMPEALSQPSDMPDRSRHGAGHRACRTVRCHGARLHARKNTTPDVIEVGRRDPTLGRSGRMGLHAGRSHAAPGDADARAEVGGAEGSCWVCAVSCHSLAMPMCRPRWPEPNAECWTEVSEAGELHLGGDSDDRTGCAERARGGWGRAGRDAKLFPVTPMRRPCGAGGTQAVQASSPPRRR